MRKNKNGKFLDSAKKINWNLVVDELLGNMFLSQKELARRCKVSQQSVSNWQNRTLSPGIRAKRMISEFAQKEGIDLGIYEKDYAKKELVKYIEKREGRGFLRISEIYLMMPREARIEFLAYAITLV